MSISVATQNNGSPALFPRVDEFFLMRLHQAAAAFNQAGSFYSTKNKDDEEASATSNTSESDRLHDQPDPVNSRGIIPTQQNGTSSYDALRAQIVADVANHWTGRGGRFVVGEETNSSDARQDEVHEAILAWIQELASTYAPTYSPFERFTTKTNSLFIGPVRPLPISDREFVESHFEIDRSIEIPTEVRCKCGPGYNCRARWKSAGVKAILTELRDKQFVESHFQIDQQVPSSTVGKRQLFRCKCVYPGDCSVRQYSAGVLKILVGLGLEPSVG